MGLWGLGFVVGFGVWGFGVWGLSTNVGRAQADTTRVCCHSLQPHARNLVGHKLAEYADMPHARRHRPDMARAALCGPKSSQRGRSLGRASARGGAHDEKGSGGCCHTLADGNAGGSGATVGARGYISGRRMSAMWEGERLGTRGGWVACRVGGGCRRLRGRAGLGGQEQVGGLKWEASHF